MFCKEYFMYIFFCKNIQIYIFKVVLQYEIFILFFVCSIEINWDLVIKIFFIFLCSIFGQSFLVFIFGFLDVFKFILFFFQVFVIREVFGFFLNVFSVFCLNVRGFQLFVQCQFFERFFKVFLFLDYFLVMRRRRSFDFFGKLLGFIL